MNYKFKLLHLPTISVSWVALGGEAREVAYVQTLVLSI